MQHKPQGARSGAPNAIHSVVGVPTVQTILFQKAVVQNNGETQAFINPVQVMLGDKFPVAFDLVILSSVHGAGRGQLACTHTIEVDGDEVFRYDHAATPITYDGTGVSFRLEMADLEIAQPCMLLIKTVLSNGLRGQDISLRVVDQSGLQGGKGRMVLQG